MDEQEDESKCDSDYSDKRWCPVHRVVAVFVFCSARRATHGICCCDGSCEKRGASQGEYRREIE